TNAQNYFVGRSGGSVFHNYFIFDLGSAPGSITAAALRLFNPSDGGSLGASDAYGVFDVSTPIATLNAGGGGVTTYNDLGSGTQYGSATASDASPGQMVEIVPSAAAVNDLNAASGSFAFGGARITLLSTDGGIFGHTNTSN